MKKVFLGQKAMQSFSKVMILARLSRLCPIVWHWLNFGWGLNDAWLLNNFNKLFAKAFIYDNCHEGEQFIIL
jgi:hypothetical protein